VQTHTSLYNKKREGKKKEGKKNGKQQRWWHDFARLCVKTNKKSNIHRTSNVCTSDRFAGNVSRDEPTIERDVVVDSGKNVYTTTVHLSGQQLKSKPPQPHPGPSW
jgi:hypothetical protein